MEAKLVIRERFVFGDGSFAEMVVWRVPEPVPPTDHFFKYRLAYIVGGKRVIGYDNERGKGDHRHRFGREESFEFTTIENVLQSFLNDVAHLRST